MNDLEVEGTRSGRALQGGARPCPISQGLQARCAVHRLCAAARCCVGGQLHEGDRLPVPSKRDGMSTERSIRVDFDHGSVTLAPAARRHRCPMRPGAGAQVWTILFQSAGPLERIV